MFPLKGMEHRLELDGWKSAIRFSACHMLLRHDKCSRLHGHSYCIHLKVHGTIDENNMVVDFGKIKSRLRDFAKDLDHMTLVPTRNDDIKILDNKEDGTVNVDMCGKRYTFPVEDVKFLPIPTTTVEEMSKYLLEKLLEEFDFPSTITGVELGMDEGMGQGAWACVNLEGK
jgi:6-pyruvoyltetrahydropterin/6-carboxytetrahydropterin synthase